MSKIEDLVSKIAEEICAKEGMELYDVEYKKEGNDYFLRIYIDKPGGVSIDDCEKISKIIDPILDEKDPIKEAYYLEVSSPGIERHLRKPEHFQKAIGQEIDIKLFSPIDKKKHLTGTLLSYNGNILTLDSEGKTYEIEKDKISQARIAFKF
ncbi:MAG: ribosome maturation factor RimP [Clostridiaceae bacterium]|nr:ribosome maturation factor RimP [Clostridiaceae bacterium]